MLEKFEEVYTAACDHEPTEEEMKVIDLLLNKEYANIDEAIILAFLVGRFTK